MIVTVNGQVMSVSQKAKDDRIVETATLYQDGDSELSRVVLAEGVKVEKGKEVSIEGRLSCFVDSRSGSVIKLVYQLKK